MLRSLIALLLLPALALAQSIDFTAYDGLLKKHVNATGMVAYRTLKASAADGAALDAFLGRMSEAKPETFATSGERLAFWINAYNACCIKGVLMRYPLDSVMSAPNFFKQKAFKIAGEMLSLDTIENVTIRPVFKDPRIHFALVCAAKSCPRLLNRAYTGVGLEATLDAQAREFLADTSKNRFEAAGPVARVSKIFSWFASDFSENALSVPNYLKKYAPAAAQPLLASPALKVEFLEYDWKLNAQ